jgi:hypothetical protein
MNQTLKGATAITALASLLTLVSLPARPASASPIDPATLRSEGYEQRGPKAETPVPDLRAALAAARWEAIRQDPRPPELRQIQQEESELAKRKAAALAKIGTGTIIGSVSVIAGIGLAVLGVNKNKKEEDQGVPDSERTSGYYYLGGLLVGLGGGSWGFTLRRHGKAELDALAAQKIAFGLDSHGHPVVAWVIHF